MTQQISKLPPLREEFDFRGVPADHLDLAIHYEYWREVPWAVEEFKRWHARKLQLPADWPDRDEWLEVTTVQDAMEIMERREVPFEVSEAITDCMPGSLKSHPLDDVFLISPFFPRPFLRVRGIDDSPQLLTHLSSDKRTKAFLLLREMPVWSDAQRLRMEEQGEFLYPVRISVGRGAADAIKDATAEIKRLYERFRKRSPSQASALAKPIAKAASRPWHELKELSAFRLKKSDMNHPQAQRFLQEWTRKNSKEGPNEVLPFYNPSGWSKAVKRAEERILRLGKQSIQVED